VQRLLTGTTAYFADLARASVAGWSRFFFTPADPTPLGLIRVAVGLLLFWSLLVTGFDFSSYLGAHAWADPAAVRDFFADRVPSAWSFWLWLPEAALRPAWVASLFILARFTLGVFSRVTAPLAWVIAVSTARRSPVMLYGFDQVITTWALYLAVCGASGQAVSIDRLLARWRVARRAFSTRSKDLGRNLPSGVPASSVAANLGLRLIQLHIALIYGMAGLAKLRGDAWWNGFAVWGVVASGEFRRFDLTWLASWPTLLNLMTHSGLAFELLYPVLIWNRRLRPLLIAVAIMMHGMIDLTLGLTEFGLAMVAGNLAFFSGPWLRSLVTGTDTSRPALRVLFDGGCPKCRASMAVLTAADPNRLIAPVDLTTVDLASIDRSLNREACMRAMHAVDRRGRITAGFDAVRAIGFTLPLFWPLAWVGVLPGVPPIGRRLYNHIAESRRRDGPCTDEACGLHAHHAPASASRDAESASPRKMPGSAE
jgi:predicted DCC family thiol-disulfide oxidoreductase YuxK